MNWISWLSGIWSGFWSVFSFKKAVEFTTEDYNDILFSKKHEEEKPPEEPEKKFDTYSQHRIGVITKMQPDYCLIDGKFFTELSELQTEIKLGDRVKFVAYIVDANRDPKITNVTLMERDQWERGRDTTEVESYIIGENATIRKNEPGIVKGRSGRNLKIEPPGVECNMDKVKMEFIPIVGDHVLLTAIVEMVEKCGKFEENIIEVKEIQYRGCKTLDGRVTHVEVTDDDVRGIINRDIYFTKNECESGYTPAVNDEVAATVIESTQGELLWRAIKVIPPPEFDQGPDYAQIFAQEKLFENKMGIEVETISPKMNIRIGESATYRVIIKNRNQHNDSLLKIVLRNFQDSDVVMIKADFTEPMVIPAQDKVTIEVEVKPDSPGCVRESLILHFGGDFEIGTGIEFVGVDDRCGDSIANYEQPQRIGVRGKVMEKRSAAVKKLTVPTKTGFIVPGVRPIKPASFIPNRLDLFSIPKNLSNILLNEEDTFRKFSDIEDAVVRLYPYMIEELNENNYLQKFHNLLHIEDQELQISIKKYDKERVSFDRKGEYLALEMPNLFESRPSLVIGDKVMATDPAIFGKTDTKYEGYIHKVNAHSIYLKFNDSFHSKYSGKDYSITFTHSRTGIRRCHQAIKLVHTHLGRSWLFPDTLNNLKRPQVSIISEYPPIEKQVEEKHECPGEEAENGETKSNPEFKYPTLEDFNRKDQVLKWINVKLNSFQKDAVRNILKGEARPFPYVIFGPPGTGKTVTVVETILQIKLQIPCSRILVTTPSNSSADLICDRLLSWNLLVPGDLVRIVGFNYINEDRIPAHLKPFCTVVDMKGGNGVGNGTYEEDNIKYSDKNAIGRHTITVGTCVSVGILYQMGFPKSHFTHVIIDEAGQATEPEISIPLAFLSSENQAILAGDPRQLGPVITSRVAESLGLGESLLSRFLMRFPYHRDPESYPDTNGYDPRLVTWLLYNYRSLPQILNLYSDLSYEGKLRPMVCDKCSDEAQILQKLSSNICNFKPKSRGTATSIIFHGVRGANNQEDDSPSWFNDHEVIKVIDYLQDVYKCGIKNDDVGIITPYQKQVMKIREMIRRFELELPKVGSVEEFQGQERKVIILSTVRSDEGLLDKDKRHALGFVGCKQRLNVAISRARCALVIIGNPHLLVKDISWRSVLKTCVDSGCYTGCDLPLLMVQPK